MLEIAKTLMGGFYENIVIFFWTLALAMVGEGTDYDDLTVNLDNNFGLQEYGIGFRLGSDVTELVNNAIIELTKDGTVAQIAEKYGLTDMLVPVDAE